MYQVKDQAEEMKKKKGAAASLGRTKKIRIKSKD